MVYPCLFDDLSHRVFPSFRPNAGMSPGWKVRIIAVDRGGRRDSQGIGDHRIVRESPVRGLRGGDAEEVEIVRRRGLIPFHHVLRTGCLPGINLDRG